MQQRSHLIVHSILVIAMGRAITSFMSIMFVYWMEQQGYNVAYTTDVDTDAHPAELLKHKAFLSVGHDEYWSMGMRNAVQSAINAGVNVAFFPGIHVLADPLRAKYCWCGRSH